MLAHDAAGTVGEARRLWQALGRENVFIKVPGTPEAVPVIRSLLTEGINVNVTLLFSRRLRAGRRGPRGRAGGSGRPRPGPLAGGERGQLLRLPRRLDDRRHAGEAGGGFRVARAAGAGPGPAREDRIANAKLAYQDWRARTAEPRWARLAGAAARSRSGCCGPAPAPRTRSYRDVMYVEELIGPETVDTMPPATFEAFRDHGRVRPTLEADLDGARGALAELAQLGISMDQVTDKLLVEAIRLFQEPFAKLLAAIEARRAAAVRPTDSSQP